MTEAQVSSVGTISQSVAHDGTGTDNDSLGLFQQRPFAGWGTWPSSQPADALAAHVERLMDPVWQTQVFLAHLRAVPNWTVLSYAEAAQAVQVSAFPDAYARWQPLAVQLLASSADAPAVALRSYSLNADGAPGSTTVGAVTGVCGSGSAVNGAAAAVLAAGRSQIGLPYAWGGGTYDGPSRCIGGGLCEGSPGFDCSGLARYMIYQATGYRVGPRTANGIYLAAESMGMSYVAWTSAADLQAGDLVFFASCASCCITHVAVANGAGGYIESRTGGVQEDPAWTTSWMGVVRPDYSVEVDR